MHSALEEGNKGIELDHVDFMRMGARGYAMV